jgi:hypothetical protein
VGQLAIFQQKKLQMSSQTVLWLNAEARVGDPLV